MKNILALFSCCFALLPKADAQKVSLYGYVQKSTPGIVANKDFDENGNTIKLKNKALDNYYMYLSNPFKSKIYVIEGWIKGERVGIKAQQVTTPVVIAKESGGEVTLVPKTSGKVMRLTGTKETAEKKFEKAKALSKTNELVVVYKLKATFYYATLKKFKELETVHLQ